MIEALSNRKADFFDSIGHQLPLGADTERFRYAPDTVAKLFWGAPASNIDSRLGLNAQR
jgi:hypothetical protein